MKRYQRLNLILSLFFIALFSGGCATYQSMVAPARHALQERDFDKALGILKPRAETEDRNQLAFALDYAAALQMAGHVQESNRMFIFADRLADRLDYHSVTNVTSSLVLNEEFVQYKGDTFEKMFINASLALNFLSLGDLDSALVEARRINEKYLKYRAEEKKNFELNPFSKYLSAIIWEADKKYDDAYIAFAEAYKIDPNISGIQEDLIRSAKLSRRDDAYKSWKSKFPQAQEDPFWYNREMGELIVFVQQGWGPEKVQSLQSRSMPALAFKYSKTQSVRLSLLEGKKLVDSERIYNIAEAANKTLLEDQGILLAKRVAALATKKVLADQVRQNNQALGNIAELGLILSERADLRQWAFLPESIQIIRIPLKPGVYKGSLLGLDQNGQLSGESKEEEFVIKKNSKKFLIWRTVK